MSTGIGRRLGPGDRADHQDSQPQPEGHVPSPLPIAAAEFKPPESRRAFGKSPNLKCTGARLVDPVPSPHMP
jgi:hypothetical protein